MKWLVSIALLAGLAGVAAADTGWGVSVRGAYAVDEGHKWFDYQHNLSVVGHRRLNTRLAVLASAGYARDTTPLWFVSVSEAHSRFSREARLVPVALGLRYSPLGERPNDPQPFLEIAPALYWYHYEAFVHSSDIFTGAEYSASDSFDHVAPGFQATAIVPIRLFGPLGIDMGISYFFSDDLSRGERLLAGPEPGVSTLAATLGFWVRP